VARVLCVGHAVQDFVFSVPRLPDCATKYRATGFASVGGGPAATAAVAIARLGGEALLAARVGDDPIADLIEAELRREGVDCRLLRRFAGRQSSLSAVVLDAAGERLIVNHADPAIPAAADWLESPLAAGAQAVLADTRWPEGALRALQLARQDGVPGILDADRPMPPGADALLGAATHVAFSADGLEDFAGAGDPRAAVAALSRRTPAWVCVTLGGEGVVVARGGRTRDLPAFRVRVVDTLGAGDVWHGAFALALAAGDDEERACRWASAAAAVKVQRRGGRAGAPRRAEVEALLAAGGTHGQ
jgi:sulfofructose kinase